MRMGPHALIHITKGHLMWHEPELQTLDQVLNFSSNCQIPSIPPTVNNPMQVLCFYC